jgi:transmembrane sensor
MEESDYSTFDIADFAADEQFVGWVLEPDIESDSFWNQWQNSNPAKAGVVHEAKLLVLLMNSRKIRMHESRKDKIWEGIQAETQIAEKVARVRKLEFSFFMKIAAGISVIVAVSSLLYFGVVASTEEIAENPKGKKSVIFLEDGTKVWLNADSRLTYFSSLENKNERVVTLEGEAFFDVTEDKSKPFIVKTGGIEIKVLGTEFNVRSFNDDSKVQTTLVHGRVAIHSEDADKNVVLTESQQAVFDRNSNNLDVSDVETAGLTSWKDGTLAFSDTEISEIAIALERWYGVEIIVEDQSSMSCRFSAMLKNEPISVFLELLKQTSNMRYEIKGKTVTLRGNLCQNNKQ